MNADARVMEFLPAPLTRAQSDLAAARLREHFERHGFGRGHAAYSRVGLWSIAGVLAIGLASVAVAYLKVRGYAT